jgi:hypothetical protein
MRPSLLFIARRYRDILRCMASSPDAVAELREVEETIAEAEAEELARKRAADGILPGNETSPESRSVGTSPGLGAPSGGRGAEGSGGHGDGAV